MSVRNEKNVEREIDYIVYSYPFGHNSDKEMMKQLYKNTLIIKRLYYSILRKQDILSPQMREANETLPQCLAYYRKKIQQVKYADEKEVRLEVVKSVSDYYTPQNNSIFAKRYFQSDDYNSCDEIFQEMYEAIAKCHGLKLVKKETLKDRTIYDIVSHR